MDPELVAAVAAVRARLPGAVVAADFDGTLAPVVADPAAARPLPEVVDALEALAARCRVVVVSGRPVAFLAPLVPAAIDLIGLYGLERRIDGVASEHPSAGPWRPAVEEAAARAAQLAAPGGPLDGLLVEPKGLSLTLHVRTRPDLEAATGRLASELSDELGLEVRVAKRSFELHPPVAVDKGTAVRDLAAGAEAVVYLGDDLGDLPALRAVDELGASGMVALGIVVGGDELPAELLAGGRPVLAGPSQVPGLLRALLAEPGTGDAS